MAVLVNGHSYSLSSKRHFQDNKTRIFVKLTDAALRAVEGYRNSSGGIGRQPAIQFLQNHGVIKIPSAQNAGTEHSFTFSLSSTADEGLQGSFECIQQNGRSLESLGGMQYKMHIQAKDDVYEATKQRMAVAEEESKKNCTKVIKASGPYVGRKVKVKKHNLVIPPKPSSPPYSSKHSGSLSSKQHVLNGSNTVVQPNGFHNQHSNKVVSSKGNPEIMKRTYRERIIQLLAIRSYKKPELVARLMKDGVKEKDKNSLSSILSQVAVMKDNSFTLAKHAFSEIQEDWPFYSETDRQLLKRRLQQNSAASGNDSPSGVQSSSTPPSLLPNPAQKRTAPELDSIPAKKQRISHFVSKSDLPAPQSSQTSSHKSDVSPLTSFNGGKSDALTSTNGVSRITSNGCNSDATGNSKTTSSSQKVEANGSQLRKGDSNVYANGLGNIPDGQTDGSGNQMTNSSSRLSSGAINGNQGHHLQEHCSRPANVTSSADDPCLTTPLGSPSHLDADYFQGNLNLLNNGSFDVADDNNQDHYDYLKKYTEIKCDEQRARYKADFNSEYEEYRCLHGVVDEVSKRFSVLRENFRNAEENSEKWLRIRDQIVKEYSAAKRNQEYQAARKRFQYMHEKLAHIKRLVAEYDRVFGIDS